MFQNKYGGSKIFQKGHLRALGWLDISNLGNTNVAEFII